MKNNTGRNIFLIVLGYYLLTGNYKGARNFLIGYVAMMLIAGIVFAVMIFHNDSTARAQEEYLMEQQKEQNALDLKEAEEYASDVLPAFVKQFKGKTLKGEFNDYTSLDSYAVKFKILNDSILSYQIAECDDYSGALYEKHQKWSKSKKTNYSLVPAVRDDGSVIKEQLVFQFENFHGELEVMKSKKKKKYRISTPLILKDADNLNACFW